MKRLTFITMMILLLGGCSTKKIDSVNVYSMENFTEEGSLISYTDAKVVNAFSKAFQQAEKEPGIVNMSDPNYKIELGNESYFLWIDGENGTMMNTNDTQTIYTLSIESVSRLKEILDE